MTNKLLENSREITPERMKRHSHRKNNAQLQMWLLMEVKSDAVKNNTAQKPWWRKVKSLSRVRLFVTPQTVAHQPPPSMGFSRREYWSGLPFPPPGDLPHPGIKPESPVSPTLQADSLPTEPLGKCYRGHMQLVKVIYAICSLCSQGILNFFNPFGCSSLLPLEN